MSPTKLEVDVAVVGASLAGCTAATLLAREGARVALVEKHSDPAAYKRLCGHFIQPSAVPVLRRLGVTDAIEAAGGVRNGIEAWTRWGWIRPGEERDHGYSIRRAKLDPLLRELAMATPGVTYVGGSAAVRLPAAGEAVVVADRARRETEIRARLVVGADGRNSTVARLAGARARTRPNNRFCYLAYYEGVERRADDRGWLWMLEPDVFIAAPNDEGLTLLAAFVHKDGMAGFKTDKDAAFERLMQRLPDAPDFSAARRVSPFVGYTDYAPVARAAAPRGDVALVGDAALTSDPTMAIGCGWALQSAEWLADAVSPALAGEVSMPRALRRYARRHRAGLAGHARMLDAAALARPANPVERLMLSAAARDADAARHFDRFASRLIGVRDFLAPGALARAAAVNVRAAVS